MTSPVTDEDNIAVVWDDDELADALDPDREGDGE
jgi:hypothetical protein